MKVRRFLYIMPVIKSAIKKLRKDIVRTRANDVLRRELDVKVRLAKKVKTAKAVSAAMSVVDRAQKKNLMHRNRAARIKSSLSKLAKPATKVAGKTLSKKVTKPASKSAVKKATTKKTPAKK